MIVTRAKYDIDFPFFKKAIKSWAKSRNPDFKLIEDMQKAGFQNVKKTRQDYTLRISKKDWCTQVRGRFWSHLSKFTEKEMDEGTQEIRDNYPDQLVFDDRILFLEGYAPK